MISTNQFRKGMAVIIDGQLFTVELSQHVKPGKGGAFVRTKLRNTRLGTIISKTFDPDKKFEQAYIDKKPLQFLYQAGDSYHFMDMKTYEELSFREAQLGDSAHYLTENLDVEGEFHDGKLVGLELPSTVVLKVLKSDPGLRGDTAKSGTKPATVANQLVVQVPLFIGPGEMIRIDTRTGLYVGRAS